MIGKVTIKDIAELVGVSTATISYYINGNYAKMSEKTRLKIKNAIEMTGYQPSVVAKGLATSDYKMIGVVIADITNPFISSVMKGIHDACREKGYTVNFTNSDNDINTEIENIRRLQQENVSGLILDSVSANNPVIKTLSNETTVMVDRQATHSNIDTIVSDNEQSTYKFVKLMQAKGYEDLYFVSYPIAGISTRSQRYTGFQRAVECQDDSRLLIVADGNEFKTKFMEIMKNRQRKTGFFTMNGPTLLDFMEQVSDTPYHYPTDYGIGSYEDLDWMKVIKPRISCIKQDSYEIGRRGVLQLLGKIKNTRQHIATETPKTIEIPTEIILRESF